MAAGSNATTLGEIVGDAQWLAHRYDEQQDAVHFAYVTRARHAELTFLTDAEIGDAPRRVLSREVCLAAVKPLAPPTPHFIIHSAYCCSTMLARAFDLPGTAMALKEPQILNDAIGLRLRGGDPRQVAAALDIALWLLARPFAAGEAVVVKPSNLVNALIPALLSLRPDVRLLFLHAPLEDFLGSVARKEIEGRAWVRELMWKFIVLGQAERFGFTEEELYRHTDLQVAALGWLAQQALFGDMIANRADAGCSLTSDTLTARPAECMTRLGALFGLGIDGDAVARGPAFSRHSKDGSTFDSADRSVERAEGLARHAREIAMVMEWSRSVAQHANIALDLPRSLLA